MAGHTTRISSPWSAHKAFEYVADVNNAPLWDPRISEVVTEIADGPELGARYLATSNGRVYECIITSYDSPRRVVVEASVSLLQARNIIEVEPMGGGCTIIHETTCELRGPAVLLTPLSATMLRRIMESRGVGLATALNGVVVS